MLNKQSKYCLNCVYYHYIYYVFYFRNFENNQISTIPQGSFKWLSTQQVMYVDKALHSFKDTVLCKIKNASYAQYSFFYLNISDIDIGFE